jgi:ribulose-5-phosphate 4-epimerase/fuculose-1-phosphate aldolase
MNTKIAKISGTEQSVSKAEWDLRVQLAAAYRLVALYGWDDLVFTHLSARVPGPEHHFLINPYGMMFEEITASSLVKIDLDGKKVVESAYEINPAGFTIHSCIHAARADANCVIPFPRNATVCSRFPNNRCSCSRRSHTTIMKVSP